MTAEQSKELLLSVQGLKKNFGEREILKGIDFDVHKGDVVCVIGSIELADQNGFTTSFLAFPEQFGITACTFSIEQFVLI